MQAQSRLSMSGSGSNMVSADELEAVIRELTRGHELTVQLREEAMRVLRGQGQAEDTAAFILQEVSRAFTLCLSIMNSPARVPPPPPPPVTVPAADPAAAARRQRDENVPRREIVTDDPFSDGYIWRKYGHKRIANTRFPRCYFKCSYQRDRGCPATKQVQQCSHGDRPQYAVIYVKEHTCDKAALKPDTASPPPPPVAGGAATNNPLLDLPGLLARQLGSERSVQEEHERQVMVSSLATVLGAHSPAGSSSSVAFGHEQQPQHGESAALAVDSTGGGGSGGRELPQVDVDSELDVMDYGVTMGTLYIGDSYGLPEDGLQF